MKRLEWKENVIATWLQVMIVAHSNQKFNNPERKELNKKLVLNFKTYFFYTLIIVYSSWIVYS